MSSKRKSEGTTLTPSKTARSPTRCSVQRITDSVLDKVQNDLVSTVKLANAQDPRFHELINLLANNTSASSLDLSGANVTAATCEQLGQLLERNKNLECLDLSFNSLGDDSCKILAASVASCSLDRLNLNDNNLTDFGLKKLADIRPRGLHISVTGNKKLTADALKSIEVSLSEYEDDEEEDGQRSTKTSSRSVSSKSKVSSSSSASPSKKAAAAATTTTTPKRGRKPASAAASASISSAGSSSSLASTKFEKYASPEKSSSSPSSSPAAAAASSSPAKDAAGEQQQPEQQKSWCSIM